MPSPPSAAPLPPSSATDGVISSLSIAQLFRQQRCVARIVYVEACPLSGNCGITQSSWLFICDVAIPASLVTSPRSRSLSLGVRCAVYGVFGQIPLYCWCCGRSTHVPLVRGEKEKGEVVGGKADDGPVSLTLAGSLHTGRRPHIAILLSLLGLVFQDRQQQIPLPSLAFHLAPCFVFFSKLPI
ncbi:hypothetical protein LZ32DRAFT_60422 [Colletotrichum eremochloae]|nr:hypothetical protein LZ32DRAFT_60422 [Colletotrichum eremochloae]